MSTGLWKLLRIHLIVVFTRKKSCSMYFHFWIDSRIVTSRVKFIILLYSVQVINKGVRYFNLEVIIFYVLYLYYIFKNSLNCDDFIFF